jgi:hypothetical protein
MILLRLGHVPQALVFRFKPALFVGIDRYGHSFLLIDYCVCVNAELAKGCALTKWCFWLCRSEMRQDLFIIWRCFSLCLFYGFLFQI